MKKIVLSLLSFFYISFAFAQTDVSIEFANTITSDDLKEHLSILASDALEGRETGKRGQKMAAAYIEYFFKSNNLEPTVYTPSGNSFLQSFELVKTQPGNTWIKIGDRQYENFIDFAYTGMKNFARPARSKLIFMGDGRAENYNVVDIHGRPVIIFSDGNRVARREKTDLAFENGASHVFIIQAGEEEKFNSTVSMYRRYASSGKLSLPPESKSTAPGYFLISVPMGADILNSNEKTILNAIERSKNGKYAAMLKIKSQDVTFYASQQIEKVSTENVLGLIEGTDKKDEYIIVSAHYDHIGINGLDVYNGADDDGSGTVAVMEMAQAFALAKKAGHGPRRSILFMTVTGEEKGLLGSSYYVDHPTLPLEKTIANLNIDMIGRVDARHESNPNYVYLIGSDKLSNELHHVSEEVNTTYSNLELDYTFNADGDPNRFYYRSDHYNFAKNNIPVIFYFNGTHADYHRPTDTIDKIEFDILTNRTKLIFHTAWEIANRKDRISVDINPPEKSIINSY